MNKFNFINQLLKNEKFTESQKERFLKLVTKELKNSEGFEQHILLEIELIKSAIGLQHRNTETSSFESGQLQNITPEELGDLLESMPAPQKTPDSRKKTGSSSKHTKYINPKYLSQFLVEYNQNPILKYTCHNIDDEDVILEIVSISGTNKYDFEKHLASILEEYKKISSKYFGKVENMHALIYTYLTGSNPKGWADDRIKIHWSSTKLKEWALKNPEKVPNPGNNIEYSGYEFVPVELRSVGGEIFLFKELVIHFKHLTHIRTDNSLKSRIVRHNTLLKLNEKCHLTFNNFHENIEFFTDVSKLIQAYDKIIKLCIEMSKKDNNSKPEIELSLIEEQSYIFFHIHHKNSAYRKSLKSSIQRIGEAQANIITKQINGLCDLILKADFDNKEYAEINLWPFQKNEFKTLENFQGVEYILKLYR